MSLLVLNTSRNNNSRIWITSNFHSVRDDRDGGSTACPGTLEAVEDTEDILLHRTAGRGRRREEAPVGIELLVGLPCWRVLQGRRRTCRRNVRLWRSTNLYYLYFYSNIINVNVALFVRHAVTSRTLWILTKFGLEILWLKVVFNTVKSNL